MTTNKNNKVGKFTGNYTQTGRKIYKTKAVQKGRGKGIKGEYVSEKSRTIPFDNKKTWVNVPSIHNGKKYSEDELIKMLKNKKIKPTSISKTYKEAIEKAKKRSSLLKPKDN